MSSAELAEHFRSRAKDILDDVHGAREYLFPVIEREGQEAGWYFAECQARASRDRVHELDEAGILADLAEVRARAVLQEDVPEVLHHSARDLHSAVTDLKRTGSQAYQIARGASVEEALTRGDTQHEDFDSMPEQAKAEGPENLAEAFRQGYLSNVAA
jgi:hypothetical protein